VVHTATFGDLTGTPSILDILAREPWRQDAACDGEVDEGLFFNEAANGRYLPILDSASLLLPLLICAGCPVRRPCLAAALVPPAVFAAEDDPAELVQQVFGVWGGSTQSDRYQVRDLPVAEAIDELERTLPERIAERIAAWSAMVDARGLTRAGGPRRGKRDKRIAAMLSGRVGRFHLGGLPGPGRGHRGPIATYAAAHGCSRDTAWRRLRASSMKVASLPVRVTTAVTHRADQGIGK
jgi:hypothetical protein